MVSYMKLVIKKNKFMSISTHNGPHSGWGTLEHQFFFCNIQWSHFVFIYASIVMFKHPSPMIRNIG